MSPGVYWTYKAWQRFGQEIDYDYEVPGWSYSRSQALMAKYNNVDRVMRDNPPVFLPGAHPLFMNETEGYPKAAITNVPGKGHTIFINLDRISSSEYDRYDKVLTLVAHEFGRQLHLVSPAVLRAAEGAVPEFAEQINTIGLFLSLAGNEPTRDDPEFIKNVVDPYALHLAERAQSKQVTVEFKTAQGEKGKITVVNPYMGLPNGDYSVDFERNKKYHADLPVVLLEFEGRSYDLSRKVLSWLQGHREHNPLGSYYNATVVSAEVSTPSTKDQLVLKLELMYRFNGGGDSWSTLRLQSQQLDIPLQIDRSERTTRLIYDEVKNKAFDVFDIALGGRLKLNFDDYSVRRGRIHFEGYFDYSDLLERGYVNYLQDRVFLVFEIDGERVETQVTLSNPESKDRYSMLSPQRVTKKSSSFFTLRDTVWSPEPIENPERIPSQSYKFSGSIPLSRLRKKPVEVKVLGISFHGQNQLKENVSMERKNIENISGRDFFIPVRRLRSSIFSSSQTSNLKEDFYLKAVHMLRNGREKPIKRLSFGLGENLLQLYYPGHWDVEELSIQFKVRKIKGHESHGREIQLNPNFSEKYSRDQIQVEHSGEYTLVKIPLRYQSGVLKGDVLNHIANGHEVGVYELQMEQIQGVVVNRDQRDSERRDYLEEFKKGPVVRYIPALGFTQEEIGQAIGVYLDSFDYGSSDTKKNFSAKSCREIFRSL